MDTPEASHSSVISTPGKPQGAYYDPMIGTREETPGASPRPMVGTAGACAVSRLRVSRVMPRAWLALIKEAWEKVSLITEEQLCGSPRSHWLMGEEVNASVFMSPKGQPQFIG